MQYRFALIYEWPSGHRLVRPLDIDSWRKGDQEALQEFGHCALPAKRVRWDTEALFLLFNPRKSEHFSNRRLLSSLEIQDMNVFPRVTSYCPITRDLSDLQSEVLFSDALFPWFKRGLLDAISITAEDGAPAWMVRGQRYLESNPLKGTETEGSSMYALLGLPPPWLQKNEVFLPWWSEVGGAEWSPW